jgi:D-alanyl-D-alanine carboxypeptidase
VRVVGGHVATRAGAQALVDAGADGVKVGFTDAARKTFVASATREGHRVFVGLMRSEDLPGDSAALLDWTWQTFAW